MESRAAEGAFFSLWCLLSRLRFLHGHVHAGTVFEFFFFAPSNGFKRQVTLSFQP